MNVILRFIPALEGRRCSRMMLSLIFVFGCLVIAQAQTLVKGKVADENNAGLPGVNILVKGTSTGTTSDANGDYAIQVPDGNSILVFSFIGYATREMSVGSQSVINVTLAPNTQSLAEVVVVGYGTQKKSDVTGAMSSVSSEALRDVPVANLSQALQGRAAGVDVTSLSPRPGGNTQIRIRGSRSLTGSNDPLMVVDGIPFSGTINDINPNDIASIDILKDASATAIYGSRGSNGVILITTRRGKVGQTQVYYNGYYGASSAVGKYKVMNGTEYDQMRKDAGNLYLPTTEEAANLAAGNETDWQDEMYKTGFITDHSIGVMGGSENTQANISAGYFKQTTVIPGQAFSRYSFQAVVDQKVGTRLKVGLSTKNQFNITDGEGISTMFSLLTLSPLFSAYNDDGTIKTLPAIGSPSPERINPLLVKDQSTWKEQRRRLRTFNSMYAEVNILEGLKYRINAGLDLWQDNYGNYSGSNTPFRSGGANGADVQNTNAYSYTIENVLTYDKSFGQHKLLFTGLFSVQETEEYRSASTSTSLPADYMYYYNLGLGTSSVPLTNNYYNKSGLLSYMGRVNYSFQDRFLATLTARADGSSRLAAGNKWFYYPAAAVSWNIHRESFLANNTVVSNLKLRGSIGTTSNQAVSPYASLGTLGGLDGRTAEPYNYGANGAFGYLVTASPNPFLTWEFTTTTNFGLDFGLYGSRISGSLEVYQQDTKDVLQNVSLPATSGVGSVTKNVGSTRNKGIELTLSTVNVERPSGFTWSTDFNLFINRSEITFLNGGVASDESRAWFVGKPIDVIFDYQKIGIVQTGDTGLPAGFTPGKIRIQDQPTVDTDGDGKPDAGDGVINAADRVVLGSLQPKWSGGLTNRVSYKGFDFNFVLFGKVGGMLVSNFYQGNASNPINSLESRTSGPKVDYWTPTNPSNKYPKPGLASQSPEYGSTMGYFDATFMKVRSIQLGYRLPTSVLSKIKASSFYIYAQAQNPFKAFFSPYVKEGGLDPEPTGFGGTSTPGYGNRPAVSINTPPTRSIIIGVNIKY